MNREIILPKTDTMFKSLFINYKSCLKSLLGELLHIPADDISILEFINPEINPDNALSKKSVLDLAVKLNNKLVNIEMQLQKTDDFVERSLYYWANLYCNGSERGKKYSVIPKTIAINILDYNMFDDDKVKHTAQATISETGEIITDRFSVIFYELPKVSDEIDPKNGVKLWLQFFKAKDAKELEMVKNAGNAGVSEAVDAVYKLSEEQRLRYLSVIEHMHDMDESIKEAETKRAIQKSWEEGVVKGHEEGIVKGRKEGIAKGIEKGRVELSKEIEDKLRKLNLTQEQIDSVLK